MAKGWPQAGIERIGKTKTSTAMKNLYLPKGMSLDSMPFTKTKDKEKAARVLSYMIRWSALSDEAQTGVQIHSKFLRKIAGGSYTRITRPLVENGIITISKRYIVGKECKTYSFVHNVTELDCIKISGNRRRKPKADFPKFLIKHFNKLTINEGAMDKEEVKKAIREKKSEIKKGKKAKNMKYVDARYNFSYRTIREKDWLFSKDENGRVHTNLTSCPRALRKELRYNGEELKGIDLKSSQPTILLCIMKTGTRECKEERIHKILREEMRCVNIVLWHKLAELTTRQGFADFQREIEDGVFYDAFMEKLPIYHPFKERRDMVKKEILKCFYGRGNERSCIRKHLWEAYPFLKEAVKLFKPVNQHQRFACLLQKVESHLFIDLIATRINREIPEAPIFTIHDSLYTIEEFKERVFRIVREESTAFLGFEPHFGYE